MSYMRKTKLSFRRSGTTVERIWRQNLHHGDSFHLSTMRFGEMEMSKWKELPGHLIRIPNDRFWIIIDEPQYEQLTDNPLIWGRTIGLYVEAYSPEEWVIIEHVEFRPSEHLESGDPINTFEGVLFNTKTGNTTALEDPMEVNSPDEIDRKYRERARFVRAVLTFMIVSHHPKAMVSKIETTEPLNRQQRRAKDRERDKRVHYNVEIESDITVQSLFNEICQRESA